MDTGTTVIVPAQLSREVEDGRPTLRRLRESGDIEQDADMVALLSSDPKTAHDDTRPVLLDLAKNRTGPTGFIALEFNRPTQRVTVAGMKAAEPTGQSRMDG